MRIYKLSFVLFCLIVQIVTIERYQDTMEALKNYPKQVKKGGKNPKFLYFFMKQNLKYNVDSYSKLFYTYLNTTGVRAYFVNIKDSILLGLIPEDAEIDVEELKENFSDLVEDVKLSLKALF
jgi:hypothetical protein